MRKIKYNKLFKMYPMQLGRRNFLQLFGATSIFSVPFFRNLTKYLINNDPMLTDHVDRETPTHWPDDVIHTIYTEKPYFGLTIDDGWFPDTFVEMLDILKRKKYRANFFLVGAAAIHCEKAYPGILERLVNEGHSIGYHTMRHYALELSTYSSSDYSKDYDEWTELFRYYLGNDLANKALKPYARAPFGSFSDEFLKFCRNRSLVPYAWARDPSEINRDRLIRKGHIFLLHIRPSDLQYLDEFDKYTAEPLHPVKIECMLRNEDCPDITPTSEDNKLFGRHIPY